MCGLYDKLPDAIGFGPSQRLLHIVNGDSLSLFYAVENCLIGEAPAYGELRKRVFHGVLDGTKGEAGLGLRGSNADNQQFLFSDTVLISGIVRLDLL